MIDVYIRTTRSNKKKEQIKCTNRLSSVFNTLKIPVGRIEALPGYFSEYTDPYGPAAIIQLEYYNMDDNVHYETFYYNDLIIIIATDIYKIDHNDPSNKDRMTFKNLCYLIKEELIHKYGGNIPDASFKSIYNARIQAGVSSKEERIKLCKQLFILSDR